MDQSTIIFRLEALRYGVDGYPAAAMWRAVPLGATGANLWPTEVVTIDEVLIAAHANRVFVWGPTAIVNRIIVVPRPFGGLMLANSPDAVSDSRLAGLPSF